MDTVAGMHTFLSVSKSQMQELKSNRIHMYLLLNF